MGIFVLAIALVLIVAMIATGWFIAAKSWADDYAEAESERRYHDKISSTTYRVHITHRIIDEMKRGDAE